jgi:hypothetical protein
MTHIVSPTRYPTKKAFREAVARDPSHVYVEDPSMFNPFSGSVSECLAYFASKSFTVTNHPRRSWYASVRLVKGKVVVK